MKFKKFKIVKMLDDYNYTFSKKIFVLKFYFATVISVHSTRMRKGKDPDPGYLCLTDPDADSGGPKT
jgi:hypothetical protein